MRAFVKRAVEHVASARPTQRQANALVLGHITYTSAEAAAAPLAALLSFLEPVAKADVETRRNAVRSLADVAVQSSQGSLIRKSPFLPTSSNSCIQSCQYISSQQSTQPASPAPSQP